MWCMIQRRCAVWCGRRSDFPLFSNRLFSGSVDAQILLSLFSTAPGPGRLPAAVLADTSASEMDPAAAARRATRRCAQHLRPLASNVGCHVSFINEKYFLLPNEVRVSIPAAAGTVYHCLLKHMIHAISAPRCLSDCTSLFLMIVYFQPSNPKKHAFVRVARACVRVACACVRVGCACRLCVRTCVRACGRD